MQVGLRARILTACACGTVPRPCFRTLLSARRAFSISVTFSEISESVAGSPCRSLPRAELTIHCASWSLSLIVRTCHLMTHLIEDLKCPSEYAVQLRVIDARKETR